VWFEGRHFCDRCPDPVMVRIESKAGLVDLCWNCALKSLGWTSERLEAQHAPFKDHLKARFKVAARKEEASNAAYFASRLRESVELEGNLV